MKFASIILMLAFCLKLCGEGIPSKTYDVEGTCYPMIYALPGDTDIEKLQATLDKARDTFIEKRYSDALYLYNRVCFAIVPKDRIIEDEADRMDQKMLHLFCDALNGRLACSYNLGMANDRRHRMEQDILNKIDDRIPKFIEEENAYIIGNQDFDDDEIEEFVKSMEEVGLVEKSADVTVLPDGSIKFKMKKEESCGACCDSCADGGECEGEKKSPNLLPKHTKSVKRCESMCDNLASSLRAIIINGSRKVRFGATLSVEALNSQCKKCCQGKGFYENCVKPLQHYINTPSDPAFNDHYDDYLNNWDVNSGKWAQDHLRRHKEYWDRIYNHGFSN